MVDDAISSATSSSRLGDAPLVGNSQPEFDDFASSLETELLEIDESESNDSQVGGDHGDAESDWDAEWAPWFEDEFRESDSHHDVGAGGDGAVEHQDISTYEFQSDLQRLIREDHMQIQDDFPYYLDDPLIGDAAQMLLDLGEVLGPDMEPQNIRDSSDQLEVANATAKQLRWPVLPPHKSQGVTEHKKNEMWEAHLWVREMQFNRTKKGVQIFLGSFYTRDEAKKAHDKAAIKLEVRVGRSGMPYPLNFSELIYAAYMQEHSGWSRRDFIWLIRRNTDKFSKGKSEMKGVTVRVTSKGVAYYEVAITMTPPKDRKRACFLGRYDSEEEAGREYDKALLLREGFYSHSHVITNFRPSLYLAAEVLEVGNWLKKKYENKTKLRDHIAGLMLTSLNAYESDGESD